MAAGLEFSMRVYVCVCSGVFCVCLRICAVHTCLRLQLWGQETDLHAAWRLELSLPWGSSSSLVVPATLLRCGRSASLFCPAGCLICHTCLFPPSSFFSFTLCSSCEIKDCTLHQTQTQTHDLAAEAELFLHTGRSYPGHPGPQCRLSVSTPFIQGSVDVCHHQCTVYAKCQFCVLFFWKK